MFKHYVIKVSYISINYQALENLLLTMTFHCSWFSNNFLLISPPEWLSFFQKTRRYLYDNWKTNSTSKLNGMS